MHPNGIGWHKTHSALAQTWRRLSALILVAAALTIVPLPSIVGAEESQTRLARRWAGTVVCQSGDLSLSLAVSARRGSDFKARLTGRETLSPRRSVAIDLTVVGRIDRDGTVTFTPERWYTAGDLSIETFAISAKLSEDRGTITGVFRIGTCAEFSLTRQDKVRWYEEKPIRVMPARTLAEFRDTAVWTYAGAEVAARFSVLEDGKGRMHLESVAMSGHFKYFAQPMTTMILVDKNGHVVSSVSLWDMLTGMSMGHVDTKRKSTMHTVAPRDLDKATHVFFGFKFCAWRQTFERTVGETSGCHQSSQRPEYIAFTKALPAKMQELNVAVGERFTLLGWRGIRLK